MAGDPLEKALPLARVGCPTIGNPGSHEGRLGFIAREALLAVERGGAIREVVTNVVERVVDNVDTDR